MNSGNVRPLVLFFTAEAVATEDEIKAAEAVVGVNRLMLNGEIAGSEPARRCDFVAGAVPKNYADKPEYSKAAVAKFVKQTEAGELPEASKPIDPPVSGGTSHATGDGQPQSFAPPQNPNDPGTPLTDADKAKGAAAWGKARS